MRSAALHGLDSSTTTNEKHQVHGRCHPCHAVVVTRSMRIWHNADSLTRFTSAGPPLANLNWTALFAEDTAEPYLGLVRLETPRQSVYRAPDNTVHLWHWLLHNGATRVGFEAKGDHTAWNATFAAGTLNVSNRVRVMRSPKELL